MVLIMSPRFLRSTRYLRNGARIGVLILGVIDHVVHRHIDMGSITTVAVPAGLAGQSVVVG
jgi:hypothetical protein